MHLVPLLPKAVPVHEALVLNATPHALQPLTTATQMITYRAIAEVSSWARSLGSPKPQNPPKPLISCKAANA
jgi:hypothetical protein